MKTKTEASSTFDQAFEFKEHGVKYNLSKYEYDLYKEEDDVATKIVRIKRMSLPNKGVNWKIIEDAKTVALIEGAKLSGKERDYLHTVDGINFILKHFKSGWKSLAHFRKELKPVLK